MAPDFSLNDERNRLGDFANLGEFAVLPEDWDSYGGRPPSPLSILLTLRILSWIQKRSTDHHDEGWPRRAWPWHVGPHPGGMSLEWDSPRWTLWITIDHDGEIGYLWTSQQPADNPRGHVILRAMEADDVSMRFVLALVEVYARIVDDPSISTDDYWPLIGPKELHESALPLPTLEPLIDHGEV